jgi:hypothetical protein
MINKRCSRILIDRPSEVLVLKKELMQVLMLMKRVGLKKKKMELIRMKILCPEYKMLKGMVHLK